MSRKQREALLAVYDCAKDGVLSIRESAFEKVIEALAEPIRNCDVGTAAEQKERIDAYCEEHRCKNCPHASPNENESGVCTLGWAQAPYEGGTGNQESERKSVMNDVLKREVNHAYIPQAVQVAIDTILSYAYTTTLENQVLRRRLEYAKRLIDEREIDKEIAATHMDIEASESTRIRKIVNETLPAPGQ